MKKFSFTIRGNQYDVNIKNIEDDIADIEVNGTRYEVEIHRAVKQAKTPKLMRSKIEPLEHGEKARTSSPTEKKGAGIVKAPLPGTISGSKSKAGRFGEDRRYSSDNGSYENGEQYKSRQTRKSRSD
jgi:hypothetical protein